MCPPAQSYRKQTVLTVKQRLHNEISKVINQLINNLTDLLTDRPCETDLKLKGTKFR